MFYCFDITCFILMIVQVISHKDFKTRQDFDAALDDKLKQENIDIVCLAGFMRILSGH